MEDELVYVINCESGFFSYGIDCAEASAAFLLRHKLEEEDREMSVLLLYTLEQMEKDPKGATLQDLDLGRSFYCD